LLSLNAEAKDKWVETRSAHFRVFSNAGEKRAKEAAFNFEQLRYVFSQAFPDQRIDSAIPTEIFLFKNEKSMRPYQPLKDGKPEDWVAYFRSSSYKNTIAFVLGRSGDTARQRAFHQYIHLVLSYEDVRDPVWLREGLAEYYETTLIRKDKAHIGKIKERHLRTLNSRVHIPLEKLFVVDWNSPYYLDSDKRAHFDAESWALIHYLLVGKDPEGRRQLGEYLRLLREGRKLAFQEAFHTNPRQLDHELRNYIDNRIYQHFVMSLQPIDLKKDLSTTVLSETRARIHLGDLLASIERYDDAAEHFADALEAETDLTEVYESLGFLYLRRRDYAKAKGYLAMAVERGTDEPIVHYEYASTLLRDYLGGTVESIPDEILGAATSSLERAISSAPELADAARLLAFVHLVRDENLEEGIEIAEDALKRAPGHRRLLYVLGQLYSSAEYYSDAQKVFAHLSQTEDDPSMVADLRRRLDYVEVQLQRGKGRGVDRWGGLEGQAKHGTIKEVKGTFKTLHCPPEGGLVFVIASGDRVFRFQTEKPPVLQLSRQGDPVREMTFRCGAQTASVVARYVPLPPEGESAGYELDGRLIALDLLGN
jgi:tetratricopeptide (TPR) repeat protein